MQPPLHFAEVAVSLPIEQTFTYTIPELWKNTVKIGQRVLVPFGTRKLTGHVVDLPQSGKESGKLKSLIEIIDPEPVFNPAMLDFLKWVSAYYHAPMGEVLRTATPAGINLQSMRRVTLTELGRGQFDPTRIETPLDHVFKILEEKGSSRVSSLLRLSGVNEGLLKRFQKEGFIEIDQALEKVRVRIRKEHFVKLLPGTLPKDMKERARSNKQKEVWQFLASQGEVSLAALEKSIKGSRAIMKRLALQGLISIEERDGERNPFAQFTARKEDSHEIILNADQEKVFASILDSIAAAKHQTFLLHGVTGSGKTEIYIQTVRAVIAQGKQAIVLVPEISLTAQMVSRFHARFGDAIALMHSGLSDGERYDQWRKILKGEVKIVIGARSAVFAPFTHLGVLIIDEEHETSFKQESGLLYQARDLAIARARFCDAVVILGSATPSVESFYNTEQKKFTLLELPDRIAKRRMPEVKIVDMTKAALVYRSFSPQFPKKRMPIFSKELIDAVETCLQNGEQSILFLNRRGYAPFLLCTACGEALRCPKCEISLTYYQGKGTLTCHYCEHTEPLKKTCPSCKEETLNPLGFGTESLEEEINVHFPKARVVRLDRDTTTKKGAHKKILDQVHEGEADILIGTQMVAKGHHFPRVTLVGVISADISLHMPDFRSGERTFQLLTQVAGRAGRGDKLGKVFIQTHSPEHYSLLCARRHDFHGFYREEVEQRRALHYPPFSRLICFRLTCAEKAAGEKAVVFFKRFAEDLLKNDAVYREHIRILGPAIAPKARLGGEFRWQMLLKSANTKALHRYTFQLRKMLSADQAVKALRIQVDVDPLNLM